MNKRFKKLLSLFIILVMVVSITGCKESAPTGEQAQQEQENFDAFLMDEFKEAVTTDSITLHYTLKDPSIYDIEDFDPTFGNLDLAKIEEDEAKTEETLKKLEDFNYKALNDEQKLTYDILKSYLEAAIAANGLTLYQTILGPTLGVQSQLPVLLAEYSFYSEKDVKDYLLLLEDLDNYFKQIILFEQEKSKNGLFMADFAVDDIVKQCEEFIGDSDDNFLIEVFNDKIDQMNELSTDQKKTYKSDHKAAVTNHVIPAYENLITDLTKLKGTGKNEGGLCNFEKGSEYYEHLVRATTGSSKTIKELADLIDKRMSTKTMALQRIAMSSPNILDSYGNENYGSDDPAQLLKDLKNDMQKEYPAPPEVNYDIKTVHKSLANSLSPAFYLIPPIDDPSENAIYINSLADNYNASLLYPTLAHEGYPGHLYQNTYFNVSQPHPIRSILNFGGYSEGWATYVENHSYELVDFGEDNDDVTELKKIDMEFNLALCSRIDIGVNYEGWKRDMVSEYLNNFGIGDDETTDSLFKTVVEEPGNYLQYYIGFLEFENLRDSASKKLGDNFDLKEFNKVLLDVGPAPFDIIENAVNTYIDSTK